METNNYYYNCKISTPILHQDAELISFNGFAWSNSMGMIHETLGQQGTQQWLGTQP